MVSFKKSERVGLLIVKIKQNLTALSLSFPTNLCRFTVFYVPFYRVKIPQSAVKI
ncbi:hypothetical protein [Rodentibacter trehalosifermentans]|uniref:hypothetical protein n=1 Tax=Rodentibacter trehalosifermentans TaxID=1908263 RepID=UPI00130136BA|nr:hypothetical protein [Rodentibacter trehalosifermentans]